MPKVPKTKAQPALVLLTVAEACTVGEEEAYLAVAAMDVAASVEGDIHGFSVEQEGECWSSGHSWIELSRKYRAVILRYLRFREPKWQVIDEGAIIYAVSTFFKADNSVIKWWTDYTIF